MAEGSVPPFRRTGLVFLCLSLGPERKCSCRAEGSVHSTEAVVGRRKRRKRAKKKGGMEEKEQRWGKRERKRKKEGRARRGCLTFLSQPYLLQDF